MLAAVNRHRRVMMFAGLLMLLAPRLPAAEEQPRWLAIVAPGLVEAVQPLVARRRDDGWEVRLHTVSETDNWESQLAWIKLHVADSSTPTCLVLVGDWIAASENCYVPPALGQHGRMRSKPTDFAYALPDAQGSTTLAVGRLPARSPDELGAMIAKIVRFEEQQIGPWSNRVNLWVGHPGGNSPVEKKLAEAVIQSSVGSRLQSIPPTWHVRTLVDFPGTPHTVPRDDFATRVTDEWKFGQCFSVYAGHSGAIGFWSDGRCVVPRDTFASIQIEHSPGVLVTTGCHACQLNGIDGPGYLLAGMRNPGGPVACIGPFAESHAVHGQLVLDSLVNCLTTEQTSGRRLGFISLAAQRGIGQGQISPLTFWLYDQADGSRGQVSLADQRLEHLEMWTLLGDPALKIPALPPTLDVAVTRVAQDAKKIRIATKFPVDVTAGKVYLHCLLRPASGERNQSAPMALLHESVLDFTATGRSFDQEWELPETFEGRDIIVRVWLSTGTHGWFGIGESRNRTMGIRTIEENSELRRNPLPSGGFNPRGVLPVRLLSRIPEVLR